MTTSTNWGDETIVLGELTNSSMFILADDDLDTNVPHPIIYFRIFDWPNK